ncbi:MAG: matrixin family metalloprotease [Acidimicrobiales bacterium]
MAGIGGSGWVPVPSNNAKVYVSGLVTLDGPQFEEILQRPDGRDQARAVILHELGHLAGLDHVEDSTQLMNAVGSQDVTGFAVGDLIGLAELGRGACFPSI